MKNIFLITFAVIFFISMTQTFSYSQKVTYTAGLGFAKLTGHGGEPWNLGFTLAGQGFYHLTSNILVGARVAYNRFAPDVGYLTRINVTGLEYVVSGSASIFELLPNVRFMFPTSGAQSLSFFTQAGFGLYLTSFSASVEASIDGLSVKETCEHSESQFGLNLGAGIIIAQIKGWRFEILPLYHIIFTEGSKTNYFFVCVSAMFGK